MFSTLQVYTFQVAIVTDNVTTFAAYIYEDPCSIQSGLPAISVIGFSKGDRRRFSNIGSESVQSVNTYRIDGKIVATEGNSNSILLLSTQSKTAVCPIPFYSVSFPYCFRTTQLCFHYAILCIHIRASSRKSPKGAQNRSSKKIFFWEGG